MNIKNIALQTCFISALLSSPAYAADLMIKNATVFDGTGSALIKNAHVLIEDGKVKAVKTGKIKDKADRVIDAQGKTVMPGLINAHLHLFWNFYDFPIKMPATSNAEAKTFIQGELTERLNGHLQYGITSILSPIDFAPYIYEVRELVEKGEIKGPRIIAAGPVLLKSGDYYACAGLTGKQEQWCNTHVRLSIDTPQQARASVQKLVQDNADVVVFDGVTNQTQLSKAVMSAIVDEAHKHKLNVLAHNADAKDVNMLLEVGIDGFVHPPTVTKDTDGSLLLKAGQQQKPVAITLGFLQRFIGLGYAEDKDKHDYDVLRNNVQVMLKAGAQPLFTSDMPGIPPKEVVPTVTRVMKGEGIDNRSILLSATSIAAKALGQHNLGTLEKGKIADLIILDGNPLQDISALERVEVVIKDGRVEFDQFKAK
ncbi:amidohydrolase family protein [uncultured Acinetobacter sp.]|uniref:amidohydrolase family protein n=1 Tax=uncultured Acinetobacter sp. TaxID=165433 RepID=UPI00262B2C15|nr:amidohydrolase family protein [uncultured Acinetobacter sp.]